MTKVRAIRTGTGVWTWAPLFWWTPWRWHSDTETCGSWYSSWIVFHVLYFTECICRMLYWIQENARYE